MNTPTQRRPRLVPTTRGAVVGILFTIAMLSVGFARCFEVI